MVINEKPAPADESPQMSGGLKRLSAFILISMACVAAAFLTPVGKYFSVQNIQQVAHALGFWGPVIILAAGVITPILFIPRWPVAFVAGLLYGVVWGSVLANVASALGAWLHFAMAKTLLAPASQRLLRKYGMADLSVPHEKTFMALFFLRAFPLSNFVATNLLAGALKVHSGTYLAASFLGMIPSTLMYASWGKLMKKPSPWFYALAAASLAFIIVGTVIAQRRFYPWLKSVRAKSPAQDGQA